MRLDTPWLGPIGQATWLFTLRLLETLTLGRHAWWRHMRAGLNREFRDLSPHRMVVNLRGDDPQELAYGESPPLTVLRVLDRLALPPGCRFVDLGSGRGIPCFVAHARGMQAKGLEFFKPYVERCQRIASHYGWEIEFVQGSFLRLPLPEAELYWISSSAFPETLRGELQSVLQQAPPGSWIVTQDWVLEGPEFSLELAQQLPVSWGVARFCYHRRVCLQK